MNIKNFKIMPFIYRKQQQQKMPVRIISYVKVLCLPGNC